MRFLFIMDSTIKLLWMFSTALQVIIIIFMTVRKLYRDIPATYWYVLAALLQTLVVSLVYATKGFTSWAGFYAAWISQAVVVFVRWLAVCGLCRAILGRFRGIWALTWRVLVLCGLISLISALLVGKHDALRIVNTFDLGLEFSICSVLTGLFLFARYYYVQIQAPLRTIAIAFCLYSCFRAFNDTVLQTYLDDYTQTWSLVDGVTYLATLVLIAGAVYVLQPHTTLRAELLPQ